MGWRKPFTIKGFVGTSCSFIYTIAFALKLVANLPY